jgi:hypothetical protein
VKKMVKIDESVNCESLIVESADRQDSDGFKDNEVDSADSNLQIVPYCYFLRYARMYDSRWQKHLAKYEKIILHHKKLFSPRREWPDEVAMNVISYMDAKSLAKASRLSKQWQNLCADNRIWEYLCVHNYGLSSEVCNYSGNAKQLYRLMVDSLRSIVQKKNTFGGLSNMNLTLNVSSTF